MSAIVVQSGAMITKDPADIKVFAMDWDAANLKTGVIISTSTWTITAIKPSTSDTNLTKDSETKLTAAQATSALQGLRTVTLDDRMTQVRLSAGTLGQVYEVANKIVTNESPSQTKERSFRIFVENK